MISRIFRGEKRLVFVDSRARAERLADTLRRLEVRTFVTHSSLSRDERGRSEDAFHNSENCVIVATSVLELGVDVGDLDRVIQIDSPPTVSAFLQRMGRTGRRDEGNRNCLFLVTRSDVLLRAASIIQLFEEGYVEPITPPSKPYHILAQQLLALILQENGIGKQTWLKWLERVPAFATMDRKEIAVLVEWMLEQNVLVEDQGILGIGCVGEKAYGRKNFMELLSVFMSPPFFTVLHGKNELGYVDEHAFLGKEKDDSKVVLLAGRAWVVQHIDWKHHRVYVNATEIQGGAWWRGDAAGLSFRICQTIKDILGSSQMSPMWSQRSVNQIAKIRADHSWVEQKSQTFLVNRQSLIIWWTFAGLRANAMIAYGLQSEFSEKIGYDDLKITFRGIGVMSKVENAISKLQNKSIEKLLPPVHKKALQGLKFSDILPSEMALSVLQNRLGDPLAVQRIMNQSICVINDI